MPQHDYVAAEVLTAANMDAYSNNSYYFQFRQTVSQNIAASTATALTFTTEDFDTDNGHDTGSNTSRYTCQTAGKYEFYGAFSFAGDTTGQRYGLWYKNGAAINGGAVRGPGSANATMIAMRTLIIDLAVSDYVELYVSQNTVGALATLVTGDTQATMAGRRLSS